MKKQIKKPRKITPKQVPDIPAAVLVDTPSKKFHLYSQPGLAYPTRRNGDD